MHDNDMRKAVLADLMRAMDDREAKRLPGLKEKEEPKEPEDELDTPMPESKLPQVKDPEGMDPRLWDVLRAKKNAGQGGDSGD